MTTQKTSEIGSKVIRSKAIAVDIKNLRGVKKLLIDLTDSMRAGHLVGMAAPQIGISKRVFITEIQKTLYRKHVKNPDPLRVFINPKIVSVSKKEIADYEGCGSVALGGLFGKVKRPERVCIQAYNEHGELFELETGGLLARVIFHEIDHLEGICFIDKVTNTKGLLGREEYIKMRKATKK
jgi:peptide deformylase